MRLGRRFAAGAGVVACVTLFAVSAGDGLAATTPIPVGATDAAVAATPAAVEETGAQRACGNLPKFNRASAAQIMAGRVRFAPFPAVTVDPHRDGDINWAMDPFHHPTWVSDFRSGWWIAMLVSGWRAGGPSARAYRTRAAEITKSWLAGVPVSQRDPVTLICLSIAFPGKAWIQDQIPPTVDYYAAHWQGPWNHGLVQDLKLLRIGCAYLASAYGGDALAWRRTAYAQMVSAFEPNYLGPAIDAQGAVNEQATGYANFVRDLWHFTGLRELAACGYRLPSWITARIAKLPAFLAYATEPDGYLVQIGDTYVERPATAPRQRNRIAVYSAGYVFGRSSWGPGGAYYSLRFGRGRQVHGHEDHMGLTYFDRGRDLIVAAGHTGYEVTPYRAWLRSPEAASDLVLPGVPFHSSAYTSLVSDAIGGRAQFYEFYDTAFAGDPRYRSVYIGTRPDLVLVYDRARGGPEYQQLWHLDPALRVRRLTRTTAVAYAPGTKLTLTQVPLPGEAVPAHSTAVVRAQTDPYQGWVSHQALQRLPDDVVTMTRYGSSAAILTLIVPSAPNTRVTWTLSGPSHGPFRLTIRVGASTVSYTVLADGIIAVA